MSTNWHVCMFYLNYSDTKSYKGENQVMMNCQDLQQQIAVLQSMLFLKRWVMKMLGIEYLIIFSCEFTELYRYKRVSCHRQSQSPPHILLETHFNTIHCHTFYVIYVLEFTSLRQFGYMVSFWVLFPNADCCNLCYYKLKDRLIHLVNKKLYNLQTRNLFKMEINYCLLLHITND